MKIHHNIASFNSCTWRTSYKEAKQQKHGLSNVKNILRYFMLNMIWRPCMHTCAHPIYELEVEYEGGKTREKQNKTKHNIGCVCVCVSVKPVTVKFYLIWNRHIVMFGIFTQEKWWMSYKILAQHFNRLRCWWNRLISAWIRINAVSSRIHRFFRHHGSSDFVLRHFCFCFCCISIYSIYKIHLENVRLVFLQLNAISNLLAH